MAANRDYYDVLGVARTASADDIRKAHRRLARTLHPDVNKAADATKQFAEIQQAYDVLSDPAKRTQYDRFGHVGGGFNGEDAASGPRPGRRAASARGPAGAQVNAEDFSAIFEELFQRGGQGDQGRSGAARAASPVAGKDLEQEIEIDFTSAAVGGTRTLHTVDGHGNSTNFDVRIPPGIENGGRLRLRGKGSVGRRGGSAGDLLLRIKVAAHPWFRREGLDIVLDVPITIAEAALGATVDVPLLRGSVTLRIPPGSSSGRRLRVKGKGVNTADGQHGDFLANIAIVAPRELSESDTAALTALAGSLENPRSQLPWAREVSGG